MQGQQKWAGRGQRKGSAGGGRKKSEVFVTVVCAYAPTAKAPSGVKSKFSDELQDVLDKVPPWDVSVMLGDFNAREGVLKAGESDWEGVLGKYG